MGCKFSIEHEWLSALYPWFWFPGVRICFRGDTRFHFTYNLYKALDNKGIKVFFDEKNLEVGDEISPSLIEAIKESRIFVIVFSEDYASSTWCLNELVEILKCKEQNNQLMILPIFYNVDPSDIRHQRNSYGRAMDFHENRFDKDPGKVRNWRSALTKVANLKGDHFETTRYFFHLYHFFSI